MRRTEKYRREFEQALPRIERCILFAFRSVRCPHRKADLAAEAVALSWQWWVRLRQRGKQPQRFVSTLAMFAARAARSGRRVCGMERSQDVLSPVAQRRHGFTVSKLPDVHIQRDNPLTEALHDNTRTPPDEQACFRIDFPAWVATYADRERRLIRALMLGESTQALARQFGLSPSRVSQLRRQFCADWRVFLGESV